MPTSVTSLPEVLWSFLDLSLVYIKFVFPINKQFVSIDSFLDWEGHYWVSAHCYQITAPHSLKRLQQACSVHYFSKIARLKLLNLTKSSLDSYFLIGFGTEGKASQFTHVVWVSATFILEGRSDEGSLTSIRFESTVVSTSWS